MATQAFREAGFDAHNIEGGLSAWSEAGLPLEPEGGYVAESGEAAALLEARRRASSRLIPESRSGFVLFFLKPGCRRGGPETN